MCGARNVYWLDINKRYSVKLTIVFGEKNGETMAFVEKIL